MLHVEGGNLHPYMYCAHVWCRSAHTRFIDPIINNALRTVTGCLLPTPSGGQVTFIKELVAVTNLKK